MSLSLERITSALGPFIARANDSDIEKKLDALHAIVTTLTKGVTAHNNTIIEIVAENQRLVTQVKDQGGRLEDLLEERLQIYS